MTRRASLKDRVLERTTTPPARQTDDVVLGVERTRQEVIDLQVREIMPNRRQPRTIFEETALDGLAESIREHGVIQPIVVKAIPLTEFEGAGRRYELIAGERRWRASIRADRETIPAVIWRGEAEQRTMLELALVENLQRENLHPLDEALALQSLQEEMGYSQRKLAARIGKSQGYVQNRLRLLALSDDLRELVATRPDTLMHVYELAKIDAGLRAPLTEAVRQDALSYAELRAQVDALLAPAEEPETTATGSAEADEAADEDAADEPAAALPDWVSPVHRAVHQATSRLSRLPDQVAGLPDDQAQGLRAELERLQTIVQQAIAALASR
ncbi:MAG TPA: ParB/RepB/Spo0J family partition protein [Roseiflexaceae bacterium]|nr:ParB/RepB/Spo0J family partition protein [Roseiflexaceae bacterium]